MILTVLLCGSVAAGPPVLFLASGDAADDAFVQALSWDAGAEVTVQPRPRGFVTLSVSAQAEAHAEFFARAPTGLLAWTEAPTPTVYVMTSGASQPQLQVIKAEDWIEARTAFVALWQDIAARYRLGVAGPPGPLPAADPRWRATAASGSFVALVGGGDLTGYVAVRATLSRTFDPGVRLSVGVEGWPALVGLRGWGVGPTLVVGADVASTPDVQVSWGTAVIVHQWSAPARFQDPAAGVSLRTGPRVAVGLPVGAGWMAGLRAELGLWPVRTVFQVDGAVVSGVPTVDAGGTLFFGYVF